MAADRDLASAISAQYPRISLTGSVINAAESPETLFRDWFVSIGSQLIAPLLDGGQRRAEVDRTAAVLRQRFDEYGQTMLIAFREVEDTLARNAISSSGSNYSKPKSACPAGLRPIGQTIPDWRRRVP